MEELTHKRVTISVSFTVCSGIEDKLQDDIRVVREFLQDPKILSHSSDKKIAITRKSHEEYLAERQRSIEDIPSGQ